MPGDYDWEISIRKN